MLAKAAAGGVHVELAPGEGKFSHVVTVIAPDAPGLLSDAAGVLALHSLRVLSASLGVHGDSAVDTFVVTPKFGDPPDPGLLRQEPVAVPMPRRSRGCCGRPPARRGR
ncbi:protein-pii uridylyltransferase glnD [Mycobacteroides abscessus subsp. abscessus]|nr:protein-pii uridylyltransferase glnD [Mycobacteroides abscessus subsp. abscessus]